MSRQPNCNIVDYKNNVLVPKFIEDSLLTTTDPFWWLRELLEKLQSLLVS